MINEDFDLEADYVPMPVLQTGNYAVNTVNVSFDAEKQCLIFQVVTEGNDTVKSDGETPADGTNLWYRIWFPRDGDEQEVGKNGLSKKQNKINMINRNFKNMKLNVNTPSQIMSAVENGDWMGLAFTAKVELRPPDDYNPDMYNEIRNLRV